MTTILPFSKYPLLKTLNDTPDRVIAIGDVHGCYKELIELLEKVKPTPNDIVIQLGDLVDRGPDSHMAVSAMIACSLDTPTHIIRGNHDLKMLRYRQHEEKRLENPGCKNPVRVSDNFLRSYAQLDSLDLEYIATFPAVIQWNGFQFMHAGMIPGVGLRQELKGLVCNRFVERKGDKWVCAASWYKDGKWHHPETSVHWSAVYTDDIKIVYGHENRSDIHVVNRTYGLDTGVVYGNKLTAMIIDGETKEITFETVLARETYIEPME